MKKGQTEIVGLVIIVLLISIIFLFMVSFSFSKENRQNVFVRQGLAISTLEAIIKANPSETDPLTGEEGCTYGQETISPLSEFIEACINNEQSFFSDLCPHEDICVFTNSQINRLLDKTIQRYWKKDYYFRVLNDKEGSNTDLIVSTLDSNAVICPGNQDSSGPYQLETDSGVITLELNICS